MEARRKREGDRKEKKKKATERRKLSRHYRVLKTYIPGQILLPVYCVPLGNLPISLCFSFLVYKKGPLNELVFLSSVFCDPKIMGVMLS